MIREGRVAAVAQALSLTYTTPSGRLQRPNDVIRSSPWLVGQQQQHGHDGSDTAGDSF